MGDIGVFRREWNRGEAIEALEPVLRALNGGTGGKGGSGGNSGVSGRLWTFVETFLQHRTRPWQRVAAGDDITDAPALKELDDTVYRFIDAHAGKGCLDAVMFLDIVSLFTLDARPVADKALETKPQLLDAVLAAISQLVDTLRSMATGDGHHVPLDAFTLVVDAMDLLRWLGDVVRVEDAIAEDPAMTLQTLASFFDVLVPDTARAAESQIPDRTKMDRMVRLARMSLALCAWRILERAMEDEGPERGEVLVHRQDSMFYEILSSQLGLSSKFEQISFEQNEPKSPAAVSFVREEPKVDAEWYRGRIIDEQGFLYDDDVDDEEDADPLGDIDAAAEVEGDENLGEEGVDEEQAALKLDAKSKADAGPSPEGQGAPRGRGRGVGRGGGRGVGRGGGGGRGSSSGRGHSGGRGEGANAPKDVAVERGRARKAKNKAAVANHHRKDRAAKKAGRGGF
mmetsp:Transcript_122/g.358  ORF Transcript_122/g.358 Transcript_122/m.358 type:complete len:455 (-) Transcript_122:617-1981(-)